MKNINYSTITDINELETLRDKSAFKYKFDDDLIESLKKYFILKDSLFILAKSEGDFAGFCSIDRDWWEENYFMIREILVDPKFHKKGIGYELMTRCIDHAKQKGADGVVTETAFDNIPMQKLCEKIGFKKWDNPSWKEGITYKIIF
uniref:GNAT family N-acetyltransferase n=1 Tax=candidate division CPR3 bacterium TaxID=2268181 RepID=A0A7C4R6Q4_UNCC3